MRPHPGNLGRDYGGAGRRWRDPGSLSFLFSSDPAHSRPWNPDWVSHRVRDLARARYTAKAIGRLVADGLGSIPRGTCPGAPRRMSARGPRRAGTRVIG